MEAAAILIGPGYIVDGFGVIEDLELGPDLVILASINIDSQGVRTISIHK